jgi:hypothetical protein
MSRVVDRARRAGGETGITLVELLLASALTLLVVTVAGSLMLRTFVSQRDVAALTGATAGAQALAASVEAGVRNAAAVRPPVVLPGGDEFLVVRTVDHDAAGETPATRTVDWRCRAWFYDASAHAVAMRSTSASSAGAAISAPASADAFGWTVIVDRVRPPSPGSTVLAGGSGGGIDLHFSVVDDRRTSTVDDDRTLAAISTHVTQRPQGEIGGQPCFS